MLYAVGDSNSVYTFNSLREIPRRLSKLLSSSILPPLDNTLCKEGKTTDEILEKVRLKQKTVLENKEEAEKMARATGFFVFMGLNDQHTGEHTAENILKVVNKLYSLRAAVPIIVAVPFCFKKAVTKATDLKVCTHRQTAATKVKEDLENRNRVTIITVHVTDEMYVRDEFETLKKDSLQMDPLHLNTEGYRQVAEAVQNAWFQILLRAATRSYTKQKK